MTKVPTPIYNALEGKGWPCCHTLKILVDACLVTFKPGKEATAGMANARKLALGNSNMVSASAADDKRADPATAKMVKLQPVKESGSAALHCWSGIAPCDFCIGTIL